MRAPISIWNEFFTSRPDALSEVARILVCHLEAGWSFNIPISDNDWMAEVRLIGRKSGFIKLVVISDNHSFSPFTISIAT